MIREFIRFAANLPLIGKPIRMLVAIINGPDTRDATYDLRCKVADLERKSTEVDQIASKLYKLQEDATHNTKSDQAHQLSVFLACLSELNHRQIMRSMKSAPVTPSYGARNTPIKVSYIYGHCLKNDAINNAIASEMEWLESQADYDVRLFALTCERDRINFIPSQTPFDIASHPFYQQSDLVVFHFGVYYDFFNLILATPSTARRLVVFHNITPKEHLPESSHSFIDKSFAQISNMEFANHVLCDSDFNRQLVTDSGISTPCTTLALPLNSKLRAPERKPSFHDNLTRIIYIGRLVKSKGVMDLLTAVDAVLNADPDIHLKINVVCNTRLSDPDLIARTRDFMEAMKSKHSGLHSIEIDADATDEHKEHLLSEADIFVLPTLHEGFCVPILEALNAACRVVSYNNSNVPNISAGFATLVPTSDTLALTEAIKNVAKETQSDSWRKSGGEYENYRASTTSYCRQFAPSFVRKEFLSFIGNLVGLNSCNTPGDIRDACQDVN